MEPFQAEFANAEVHQLSKEYPFDAAFIEDVDAARKHLVSETLLIGDQLKIKGCSGFVMSCSIRNAQWLPRLATNEIADTKGITINDPDSGQRLSDCLGIAIDARNYAAPSRVLTRSAARASNWSVYLDGILLAGMPPPTRWRSDDDAYRTANDLAILPLPIIRLNYHSKDFAGAAVSRLTLERHDGSWDVPIWDGLTRHLQKQAAKIGPQDELHRNLQLVDRAFSYGLTAKEFSAATADWVPLCGCLNSDGTPAITSMFTEEEELPTIPGQFRYLAQHYISEIAFDIKRGAKHDTFWRGPRSVVTIASYRGEHTIVEYVLARYPLRSRESIRLQFLRGPGNHLPPLSQVVLGPPKVAQEISLPDILNIAVDDPGKLSAREREAILSGGRVILHGLYHYAGPSMKVMAWNALRATSFATPFQDAFAYGHEHWNLDHPITIAVARAASHLIRALQQEPTSKPLKRLRYLFNSGIGAFQSSDEQEMAFANKQWDAFWNEFCISGLIPHLNPPRCPQSKDFVPRTWVEKGTKFHLFDWDDDTGFQLAFERPFGQLITRWPLDEKKEIRRTRVPRR